MLENSVVDWFVASFFDMPILPDGDDLDPPRHAKRRKEGECNTLILAPPNSLLIIVSKNHTSKWNFQYLCIEYLLTVM